MLENVPRKVKPFRNFADQVFKTSQSFSNSLPSEKTVTKAMKKALKKAPNRQLKFKVLRKQVQESLSFEAGKVSKEKWKTLLQRCVDANPKRLRMDLSLHENKNEKLSSL